MGGQGAPSAPRPREVAPETDASGPGRAFRGLVLVFVLSFVNLVGVLVTATALGGVEPWSRWQFVGMFAALEVASGLANVVSPNVWRLPIAQLETERRTNVQLAASALLLPHWGGLARTAAGGVLLTLAGWQEGVGVATLGLVPLVLALAVAILAISALVARAGVARPDVDVVQFVVRWRRQESELRPLSIGASVVQLLLTIATIPAAKLLAPSVLYQPEIGPSLTALLVAVVVAGVLAGLVWAVWSDRVAARAPADQQREAEEHA
jgi:hypothetical protein